MPDDSRDWRTLQEDFRDLPQDQNWSLIWHSRPSVSSLGVQSRSQWVWWRPSDAGLRSRASAIFQRAAKARGYDSEDTWWDELRYTEFAGFRMNQSKGTSVETESGVLKEAVKHSITLCGQLEVGNVPKPLITRLPSHGVARIEESFMVLLSGFRPRWDRELEALQDGTCNRLRSRELVSEFVIHCFKEAARECMPFFGADEFEAELRAGIAAFVRFRMGQCRRLLTDAMRTEAAIGFEFFVRAQNPPGVPPGSLPAVGATTAGALMQAAKDLATERRALGPSQAAPRESSAQPVESTGSAQRGTSSPGETPIEGDKNWETVQIHFTSEFQVQAYVDGKSAVLTYEELGFADKRSKGATKPIRAWNILCCIARKHGELSVGPGGKQEWAALEKRVQEIRKRLRGHFGILSDPMPYVPGVGFRAAFEISCRPSFDRD